MNTVHYYNEEGLLKKLEFNHIPQHIEIREAQPIKAVTLQNTTISLGFQSTSLKVREYVKEGKTFFIAGMDERDRLSVLNNLVFDVHVSKEFHRSEYANRQIDVEAMLSNKLIHQLIDNLQHKITFTIRPSYTPNYIEIIASI